MIGTLVRRSTLTTLNKQIRMPVVLSMLFAMLAPLTQPAHAASVLPGEATITPSSAYSGTTVEYTVRVTNTVTSNDVLGSVKVLVPTGFTSVSLVANSLNASAWVQPRMITAGVSSSGPHILGQIHG